MTVTYQLTEGEKWKRTLKVEVAIERVQEKFEEAYKKIKSEATIPGFRPGKVPLSAVKSRFGAMAAQNVLEELMDESYAEALSEAGLEPISRPKISEIEFGEGMPMKYTAELEIKPTIALERCTGFTLKKPDDVVKEGEVKEMIEYLRRRSSSLAVVERPAQEKDFVFADLEVLSDSGGKVEEKDFKDVQLELVDGPVAGQFMRQLAGITVDDQKEIEVAYPDDHFDKRFAGSTVKFLVRVKEVKQLNLIELNEEFFHQFGEGISTMEQLQEKVRQDIQSKKSKDSEDALRDEVIKEVIDKNRFELPDAYLEHYLHHVVEDFREKYKEKFDEQQVREQYRAVGIRQIRWDLLSNEIAKKESIKVEQADIDVWLQRFADNYKMSLEEARKTITDNRRIADVKETILEKKVIDFVVANSTVEKIFSPLVQPEE